MLPAANARFQCKTTGPGGVRLLAWSLVSGACLLAIGPGRAWGQGQNFAPRERVPAVPVAPAVPSLEQGSWTYVAAPKPEPVELNDIVIVRVDELARMTSEGEMERRKNALFDAVLKDWVFFDGLKAIRPSPQSDGDPRVRGQLQELYRAEGDMETRESLALNIACRVADIRPNGNLVLEGHKQIRINNEVWEVSLSGICRRQDVGPDGLVLSRHIVDLKLDKRERGHVRDAYRRGWLLYWWDQVRVF